MRKSSFIIIAFLIFNVVLDSQAEEVKYRQQHALVFDVDDDSKNVLGPGSDQAYTGGYRIAFLSEQRERPSWWLKYSSIDKNNEKFKSTSGIVFSQQLYTPGNLSVDTRMYNDQPYAAWMYAGLNSNYSIDNKSYFFEIDLGWVGDDANGGPVQNAIHQALGDPTAKGWSNQISNEPTLQVYFQKRQKLRDFFGSNKNYDIDVIPYYGWALGNVAVKAHVGAYIRYSPGELPNDFGPTRATSEDGETFVPEEIGSHKGHNLFLFAGARASVVAHNIFLDGNTSQTSLRVSKYPLVATSDFGLGKAWKSCSLVWRFVTNSPQFAENSQFTSFAAITFTYFFELND